jgi:hypothetical protein
MLSLSSSKLKNLIQNYLKMNTERRSGHDRRQQPIKRGRWLESSDRNNRRATALNVIV